MAKGEKKPLLPKFRKSETTSSAYSTATTHRTSSASLHEHDASYLNPRKPPTIITATTPLLHFLFGLLLVENCTITLISCLNAGVSFSEVFHGDGGTSNVYAERIYLIVSFAGWMKFLGCLAAFLTASKISSASPSIIPYVFYGFGHVTVLVFVLTVIVCGVDIDQQEAIYTLANLLLSFPLVLSAVEATCLHYTVGSALKEWKKNLDLQQNDCEDQKTENEVASQDQYEKEHVRAMWRIFLPYFWPHGMKHRIHACSTYLVLGVSKAANLISPLYLASATDSLVAGNTSLVLRYLAIYVSLVLTSKLLREVQSLLYLGVKQVAYIENAQMTYRHVHSLSLEWHLKKKMGDVLRSMDRGVESANSVVSYVFLNLVPTILEAIVVLVIFAMHFQLVTLSTIGFLGLCSYAVVTVNLTLWRKQFRQKTREHDNAYHDKATDALTNFETVKAFGNEEYEVKTYTEAVEKYQQYSVWTVASLSILNGSQAIIIQVTSLSALAYSIPFVISSSHGMNIGTFVAINAYLINLFAPLSFLGTIYNMMIKSYVDMQKLGELLAIVPDIKDSPNARPLTVQCSKTGTHLGATIDVQNMSFHYPSQSPDNGLKKISLHIPGGTTTAIVGPTGAGKSTLSRLLLRFYEATEGQVLLNGQPIRDVQMKSLREVIGYVPQDTVLFHRSILENIRYGKPEATMEEVIEVTKKAQLYKFITEQCEKKWDTVVGERGLKLSGGEKQRVSIARMLLKNPSIVILDEATSSLDSQTERDIQAAINTLGQTKERTMVVIAHRLSTIQNADQIVVMKRGQVLCTGTHEELLTEEKSFKQSTEREFEGRELYKTLWHGQRRDA